MIACENLEYSAGNFYLGPIDLQIAPGITSILGPNGAGKSTLLALIAGLARPKSGRVLIEGQNPLLVSARTRAGLAASAPQNTPVAHGLITADFIAAGAFRKTRHIYNDPKVLQSLSEALETTRLAGRAMQEFASLSGGEQRRALLARALLQDAEWTLLDEPTSFLDYAHMEVLYILLQKLKKENRNLVLVTHDADFAAQVSDHIVFLREGRVYASGPKELAHCTKSLKAVFAASFTNAAGRMRQDYSG
jgi:iron complex transport system ATP-binding protein